MNSTIISSVVAALLSVRSFAAYQTALSETGGEVCSSVSRDYLDTNASTAPTVWGAPTDKQGVSLQVLRGLLEYSGLAVDDLRKAILISSSYFSENKVSPPQIVRLIANTNPEDGVGYLRMELPLSIDSIAELVDIDFDLSMRVASALDSGTEKLVVSVVQA